MAIRKTSAAVAVLAVMASLLAFGCGKSQDTAKKTAALPDAITFKKMALYPEGVDYDSQNNRFLVTSLHEGTVGTVSPDGSYAPFFEDPKMVSAIGIRIDAPRDRVLVCNSDPGVSVHTSKDTQGKLAGLAAFSLSTGELIQYVDLGSLANGGGHFCNDIAVAKDGTIYATDSFSPIIYKIDSNYDSSILLQDANLTGDGFNLNGIVVKDGYLIVAKSNDGTLYKVPLNDPAQIMPVKVEQAFNGADGLVMQTDGSLVVITNANHTIYRLVSDDNWASAKVVASKEVTADFPTTGVEVNGSLYVLGAQLNVVFNPKAEKQSEDFTIHKVVFQ